LEGIRYRAWLDGWSHHGVVLLTQVDYFTPTIGAYDYMAIKYGYLEVDGEKDGVPHPGLTTVADQNLDFATDEDDSTTIGPDPFNSKFVSTSTLTHGIVACAHARQT
jgi:hypothetical protein